jgi:hypothetical protein
VRGAAESRLHELIDDLLETNPASGKLIARSKASRRKPFVPGARRQTG